MRVKRDPDTGKAVRDDEGKAIKERHPDLWGKGDRYKVRYPKPGGGEDSKTFPDKQLKRAQTFLTKMQNDILDGAYVSPQAGKLTLRAYAENYVKGRSQDPASQETLNRQLENNVFPFLGDKHLDVIKVDTLRDFLGWLTDERALSVNYQVQIWKALSSILDAAREEKKIGANPCNSKAISPPRPVENKIVTWPEIKLNKIALALEARHKIVIPLGAGMGLRQGEIFAFSMDNVDRDQMIYRCSRQIAIIGNKLTFRLPKGHKTREVPLSQGVLDELEAYAENYPPVAITLPWSERDSKQTETVNLLMVNYQGVPDRRQTFNIRVWLPAFKRARIEHDSDGDGMHALRHLYASHLLAQGVSIRELADYLGHSSPAFTLRKYAHMMPSSHDRARLAVNSMFKPRKRAESTKDVTATGKVAPEAAESRPVDG
ncbi:site-specific integrase [Lentzea sp. NBC_00516]|uniref:tyrosine-type recombinase/integrase n=1 Tax=Lentzea sp. NBC_00516 TaxID=2903582 RepID=UPI002E80211A|nr:tyrosine-type recombinase/integrase [Lentzea sp. NBC_00516]WUD27963.1 site-specific integrase [Lentzea sp. NBC_00516]